MLEDKKISVIVCLNKCRKLLFKFLFRLFQTEGPEKCISVYTDLSIVLNSFYIFIIYIFLSSDYELDSLAIWSHCFSINQLTIFIGFKTASIAFDNFSRSARMAVVCWDNTWHMNVASQETAVSTERSMREQSTFLLASVKQMILSGKVTCFRVASSLFKYYQWHKYRTWR